MKRRRPADENDSDGVYSMNEIIVLIILSRADRHRVSRVGKHWTPSGAITAINNDNRSRTVWLRVIITIRARNL